MKLYWILWDLENILKEDKISKIICLLSTLIDILLEKPLVIA